ncbi:XRE family transcriptional regulator [Herbiconiux sp.]|jgi:transcriptional regulator with XRE-family HTH domain|uniref:helix-turn-helix domain-containing protein n=1 Tax=Herbiconiux sp. TaxID=1871186 RepID=UPI0025BF0EC0|nr:XRE family transcriptional regulator [Herbiconiux sp.]
MSFRIREIRAQRGLTVAQLAGSAGVSSGLISQVERGLADPSLETLRQIARVLEVPLFELFVDEEESSRVAVMRKGEHIEITTPATSITYTRLSKARGTIEVLQGDIAPGGESSTEPRSHAAEECIVVVAGTLSIDVDGSTVVLEAGDSCHYDSRLPHRLFNDSEEKATYIVAITPPSY